MFRNLLTSTVIVGAFCLPFIVGCGGTSVNMGKTFDMENASPEQQIVFAAKSGDLSTLKKFMEEEPNLATMYDSNGQTLLHHAARFSQVAVAEYLLENSADINAPSADDDTPLAAAEDAEANEKMIEFLEENGGVN
jgi:ankyrin repeat protein